MSAGALGQTQFRYDFCMGNLIDIDREFKLAADFYARDCMAIRERRGCTINLVSIRLLYGELDWYR